MQYAILNNERIEATPNMTAICPVCKSTVISKCGTIMVWHWAHQSKEDCDSWYEPESEWHRGWKNYFKPEEREVVIGRHRADIKVNSTVIELQNSSISAEDIQERELFYNKMIWIVNGEEFWDKSIVTFRKDNSYETFIWKHPRKCWWKATKPIYIDIDKSYPTMLFRIKKIHPNSPCRGWGFHCGKEWLLEKFNIPDIYEK
jgi:competence CoiA-like predicted nuclease